MWENALSIYSWNGYGGIKDSIAILRFTEDTLIITEQSGSAQF